ncbi:MAG: helix-turn-helix domain-containing protein [Armatimonadota bacterium]|nr:helix-turn-helix domain-containing protein [Armatimonadota bacterium]
MAERFLTVPEAAQVLRVNNDTIRRYLRDKRLRGVKVGKDWRIPEAALRELSNGLANGDSQEQRASDDKLPDLDELLDVTYAAAVRAGYKTEADFDRLVEEVRAELGHKESFDALRALGRRKRAEREQAEREEKRHAHGDGGN